MGAPSDDFAPSGLEKRIRLPPFLDMGPLKLEDLEFDLEEEVARLKGGAPAGLPTLSNLDEDVVRPAS